VTAETEAARAPPPPVTDRAALETLVAEADTGGRNPANGAIKALFAGLAIAWSLFQLWYASPLPYEAGVAIFNSSEARSIHLSFAMTLAFLAYPAFRSSPRRYVPAIDWLLAAAAVTTVLYLLVFYGAIAARPGLPTPLDVAMSAGGVVLLLEASRRAEGPWMPATSIFMLAYVFLGPFLPELMSHKGASLGRAASQFWLTSEGVFGVALGVSTDFIFLFVLFAAMLEKAGAGNYFIQLAFSLLGTLRGGPAKAGVVASGMTGMISGSSVANVVTTGTFTIPLMKRVGYTPVQAGAIESAAGVNGQIMPPVMGAAAFIMAEYVGIPYSEVVKHAFLPAILTYAALFYIVDIEAVKAGMRGIPRTRRQRLRSTALQTVMTVAGFVILCGIVFYGFGWIKGALGTASGAVMAAVLFAAYVGLVALRAKNPDLPIDDPTKALVTVPEFFRTARTGLHYFVPVGVLIWCLMVEELSPGLSAFWGAVFMAFVLLTQHPLTALFRGEAGILGQWRRGGGDIVRGLIAGGRNMAAVGIATAAAGIIVGTVTLTGIGLVMTEIVEFLSAGNFVLMLVLIAFICLVLGTGLPTTASYVVVATLMAPVMVEIAALNDLVVPLIAVHMFVFYFGLMADVSPPVGLAAYAAGAIAGADPLKVGWQATIYESRTALLPFIFIFNQEILLIDIRGPVHFAIVLGASALAMVAFVSVTQRWLLVRNRLYESLILAVVCFTLFRPTFWLDQIEPPYAVQGPEKVLATADATPKDGALRLRFETERRSGAAVARTVRLTLGTGATGLDRIRATGLTLAADGGKLVARAVRLGSQAAKLGIRQGDEVVGLLVPAQRASPQWFMLPAVLLFGAVVLLQWRRRTGGAKAAPAAA